MQHIETRLALAHRFVMDVKRALGALAVQAKQESLPIGARLQHVHHTDSLIMTRHIPKHARKEGQVEL